MLVRYEPEDGDPQLWEFDPKRIRASRAELVEKRYGKGWQEFLMDLMHGSMAARRVLLWDLIRMTHPSLRFEDTPDFFASEVVVEFTRTELEAMREAVDANHTLADDDKRIMLLALDDEIEKAPTGVDAGKAPLSNADAATG